MLALALLAAVVAVSYPVATVLVAAIALAATSAVKTVRDHRRRENRTRTVCVPNTGVCVET
jgi:membrane protein implicated in regulation of membrane protease activity